MLNLVKMDFYRLFRSKSVRMGAIAAAVVAFLGMLLNLGILEILKFSMGEGADSLGEAAMLFPIISWLSGVDFADIVFAGTNAFSLFVSCMIVASFIGAEQSCSYMKNIAGQLPNRGMTVISKFIVTCFVQLMVLLIYTAVSSICAVLFFASYISGYSILALVEGLLLRFLLFCAINAIVLFFCTLTKSHSIAMVVGAIFGIGVNRLVYFAASMLLSMVNITFDIEKMMPDGINGLISVSSVGTIAVRVIIVSMIFIVGFLISAVMLFKKRDVQ